MVNNTSGNFITISAHGSQWVKYTLCKLGYTQKILRCALYSLHIIQTDEMKLDDCSERVLLISQMSNVVNSTKTKSMNSTYLVDPEPRN